MKVPTNIPLQNKKKTCSPPGTKFIFDVDTEINKAVQFHQSGQLERAEEIYKEILEVNPNHSDSLHLSGIIAHQSGKNDIAVNMITKAIQITPREPVYYLSLGNVFKTQGNLEKAILNYQKALQLNPDYADAYNNMGILFKDQGRLDEAVLNYQKALQVNPDYAETYNNMGNAFKDQGRLEEAIFNYQKALQLNPDLIGVYHNIGAAFKDQGRLEEAIFNYQKTLQLNPDSAETYYNLGVALNEQGRIDEAISNYQKALQLNPNYADAYNNLGIVFYVQGRLSEAIACYRKAVQLKPDFAVAYNNVADAFKDQGRLSEAISCYQKALQLKPDFSVAHSNLLFSLHYHDSTDPVELFLQHQQWAARHASPLATTIQPHLNDRSTDRTLRVGYVSPDFSMHPVAHFIEPVIASHDRTAFEIFCYSDVACPDPVTDHLKSLAGCWRDIYGMSDEQVVDLIRNDQIDILVDLAGHTAYNRMLLFARKPAPVQVAYLGYPNSTGLTTMDYRITDSWADPLGQTDHLYTEELARLPHGFLCYKPPDNCPETAKLPALKTRQITFGSFNNLAKVTPEVIALWSAILAAVPQAQMIMKSKALADKNTRQRIQEMFVKNSVRAAQINLIGFVPSFAEHLALYNSVDIGLDTFPYNGATTTCEALWMGVPVIVLAGGRHVSRLGVSLLSRVGLKSLIAGKSEEYMEKAVQLAGDLKQLQELRTNLRDMMLNSTLTDASGFTHSLEEAFQKMWRQWCDQSNKCKSSYVKTFDPLTRRSMTDSRLLVDKHDSESGSKDTELEWIFIVGMVRSGSTWTYNVVRNILAVLGIGTVDGYVGEHEALDAHLRRINTEVYTKRPRLIKFHDWTETVIQMLSSGRGNAIYSQRDLRDVTVSWMDFDKSTFEQVVDSGRLDVLMEMNMFWRRQSNLMKIEYQQLMVEPEDTIHRVAAWLNFDITSDQAREIANNCSLDAAIKSMDKIKEQVAGLKKGRIFSDSHRYFDENTLLHYNHIRSAEIGRYRKRLTDAQIARLHNILGDWLIQQGYEQSADLY